MQDALADAMKLSRVLRSWLLRGPRGPAGRCAGPHREKPTCSSPPFTPPALKGWCGTHVGRARRHWRRFRAPARCRSETGAPLSRHPALRGTRRDERGLGFCADAALRAAVPTWTSAFPGRCAVSAVGVRAETGVISTVGFCTDAALRAAVPTGGRRSHRAQAGDGGVLHRRGPGAAVPGPTLPRGRRSLAYRPSLPVGYAPRPEPSRRLGFCTDAALRAAVPGPTGRNPHDRALLHTLAGHEKDPALTLTWHSVTSAGFALPRDAGRRPPPGELAGAPRPPPGELPRGRRSLACGP